MRFSEVIKTQSVDDQAFIRRSLRERECDVCHQSDWCAYLILSDAFVCSAECASNLPEAEQPIVEPDPPVVEHHEAEKKNGRSKKA